MRPTRVSGMPTSASSAITRRSQASASSIAPPMQAPWIWRPSAWPSPRAGSRPRGSGGGTRAGAGSAASAAEAAKSMPAENIVPVAAHHDAEHVAVGGGGGSASPSAGISSPLSALRFSGRLRTRWRTGPWSSVDQRRGSGTRYSMTALNLASRRPQVLRPLPHRGDVVAAGAVRAGRPGRARPGAARRRRGDACIRFLLRAAALIFVARRARAQRGRRTARPTRARCWPCLRAARADLAAAVAATRRLAGLERDRVGRGAEPRSRFGRRSSARAICAAARCVRSASSSLSGWSTWSSPPRRRRVPLAAARAVAALRPRASSRPLRAPSPRRRGRADRAGLAFTTMAVDQVARHRRPALARPGAVHRRWELFLLARGFGLSPFGASTARRARSGSASRSCGRRRRRRRQGARCSAGRSCSPARRSATAGHRPAPAPAAAARAALARERPPLGDTARE